MKKRKFAGGALALALGLLLTLGLFPQFPVEAAENMDVKVSYELDDGISSIGKGMPFGATFYFTFPQDPKIGSNEVSLNMTSSGIVLSQKNFDFDASTAFLITDESDPHCSANGSTYSFYLSEKYMTNTGKTTGTIKFTFSWKDSTTSYRAYGQKTITQCVVEEGTSSESPEEKSGLMVENYSVNKQDLREGNTFDLAITIKNNGQTACSNVAVVLPTLEQITVNGKLNAQVIASLPAGATATVTLTRFFCFHYCAV